MRLWMQLTENIFLCTGAGLRLSGYIHTKLTVPCQVTFDPKIYSLFDTCDRCVLCPDLLEEVGLGEI